MFNRITLPIRQVRRPNKSDRNPVPTPLIRYYPGTQIVSPKEDIVYDVRQGLKKSGGVKRPWRGLAEQLLAAVREIEDLRSASCAECDSDSGCVSRLFVISLADLLDCPVAPLPSW